MHHSGRDRSHGPFFALMARWVAYAARERWPRKRGLGRAVPADRSKIRDLQSLGRWPSSGAERRMARLIYVPGPGARLVRGPVRTVPARLPSIEVPFFNTAGSVERGFDLMLDGARFVSLEESSAQGGAHTAEIRVVLNWFGDLKK